jgi:tRNA A37 threonylcarbamoyladenosine modification protein TsaB
MNILSIDTSGKSFSLTLVKDSIKTSFVDTSESVSSESVLVEIDKLVSKCKISPKEITSVIYNNGPGVLREFEFPLLSFKQLDLVITVQSMVLIH